MSFSSGVVRDFFSGDLPFEAWTHKAHVHVAFCVLCEFKNNDDGFLALKNGILRYNAKHAQKIRTGYHETITRFWFEVVKKYAKGYGENEFKRFFLEQDFLRDASYIFNFYEKKTLFSEKARREFVLPKKKSLFEAPSISTQAAGV